MTDSDQQQRRHLGQARRIVVKIGSALLTSPGEGLAHARIRVWCEEINRLLEGGRQVVLVSSGAVAEGVARLGLSQRPTTVHGLQAAAAVGQMGLVQAYEQAFSAHRRRTAMILLTHDDLADRQRYLNARATLTSLLDLGVIPVINENDTVATDEIRFGDNDTLAALVSNLLQADALVILTDIDGLYEQDPRIAPQAPLVRWADAGDPRLDAMVGDGGVLGRGGMVTKLKAARIAARSGADTVIAAGREPDVLARVLAGESIGTLLSASILPLDARKRWIAGQLRAKGDLVLDDGAVAAVSSRGVSLLPVGVTAVRGRFSRGDVVRFLDAGGALVGQGLVNYSSEEAERLIGASSSEIAGRLGFALEPELVHRDNLVVLGPVRPAAT
ncbi:MAG: glutamate 5-kinase [Gammaproteobacteria bacterium]|nr:glutamate 5-kinase [Gammaproteobacteria bacterium]